MSASIRDNILFSHVYDSEFYELVLDGAPTSVALEITGNTDIDLL